MSKILDAFSAAVEMFKKKPEQYQVQKGIPLPVFGERYYNGQNYMVDTVNPASGLKISVPEQSFSQMNNEWTSPALKATQPQRAASAFNQAQKMAGSTTRIIVPQTKIQPNKPMISPTLTPMSTPISTPIPMPSSTPTPMPAPQTQPVGKLGRNPKAVTKNNIAIDAISKAAQKFGVPAEFLYDVAFTESSFQPELQNTTEEGIAAGKPTGLFQFTPQTWKDVVAYAKNPKNEIYGLIDENSSPSDPYSNAMAAAYLIKHGQLGKWDASEWNWGNYYTPSELEAQGFYDQSKYHIKGMRPTERLKKK